MKVRDILPGHPVKCMVRTNCPKNYLDEEGHGLFFGWCEWDGEKLVSLDGDWYSLDDEIYKYEYEEDGSMTYWMSVKWSSDE